MVENNKKLTGGITGKGFKAGQSGNPGGRPKMAEVFKKNCREFMDEEGWQELKNIAVATKHRDKFKALELIAAYAFGKPRQDVDVNSTEGIKIKVSLVDDD